MRQGKHTHLDYERNGGMFSLSNEISRAQIVYEHILNEILTLNYAPGSKISEEMISSQTNTSRTPIREALRRLDAEGLVVLHPNRCAQVVEFTKKDIHDMGLMRICLDIIACRLAILNGSNADYYRLQMLAEKCSEAAERLDMREQIRLDSEFHGVPRRSKAPGIFPIATT